MDSWIDAGRCGSSHYSSLIITVVVQCLGSSQLVKVTVFHIVRDFCKARGRFCKDVSLRRTVSEFLENVGTFLQKKCKTRGRFCKCVLLGRAVSQILENAGAFLEKCQALFRDVSAKMSYSGGPFHNFSKKRKTRRRFCKYVLLGRAVSQFLEMRGLF